MEEPAACSIATRCSGGSPTSCAVDFHVPGLSGHHFVVWGGDGGAINIGCVQGIEPSGPRSVPASSTYVRSLLTVWVCASDGSLVNEAVHHLAYGGGPHVVLGAATAHWLAVFSLEDLIASVFHADSAAAGSGGGASAAGGQWGEAHVPIHDASARQVEAVQCGQAEVLAISWTQQLDGLLASTSDGVLAMWQLRPLGGARTPHPAARLRRAWSVEVSEPQDALSAGVSVHAPSASASTAGERSASVWWPDEVEDGTSGGARREKLKLPCSLTALAWCPGVLRKDVLAAGLPEASGQSSPPPQQQQQQLQEEDQSKGAGGVAVSRAPEDHPALMTVGADGCVRIWVEMLVVHHPAAYPANHSSAAPHAAAPAAAAGGGAAASPPAAATFSPTSAAPQLDSYFAMALVVEAPPEHVASSSCRPLVALWGRSVGSMLGRPHAATASGTVLWLLTAAAQADPGDDSLAVRLYAVRGLSAVVVASFAGSMSGVSSLSGGGRRPQAVLWGRHVWRGGATAPSGAREDTPGTSAAAQSYSAWISSEDGFPLVHFFKAECSRSGTGVGRGGGGGGSAQLAAAGVTYATVLEETPISPRALHQQLAALSSWQAVGVAHCAPIVALRTAPAAQLVASADSDGTVIVWQGAALKPLAVLPAMRVAVGRSLGRSSLEWLHVAASGADVLAALSGGRRVTAYLVRRDLRSAEVAANVELPTEPAALHAVTSASGSGGQQLATVGAPSEGAASICLIDVESSGVGLRLTLAGAAALPAGIGRVTASAAAAELPGGLILAGSSGEVHLVAVERSAKGGGVSVSVLATLALPTAAPPAALAYAAESGQVAAVTGGEFPALVIWRAGVKGGSGTAAAAAAVPPVAPAAVVALPGACGAAAWLPRFAVPCIAVGGPSGCISLYAPSRCSGGGGWRCVAVLAGSAGMPAVHLLGVIKSGAVVGAAGAGLIALSQDVLAGPEVKPLGRHLLDACGPLPQYHPAVLQALLLTGRGAAAAAILRALAGWLPQYQWYRRQQLQSQQRYQIAAMADGSAHSGGSEAAELLSPRDGRERAPPFPAVPLSELLDPGLAQLPQQLFQALQPSGPGAALAGSAAAQEAAASSAAGSLVASGQLSMAASGDMGSFCMAPPSPPPSDVHTGMLDLAAFGMEAAPAATVSPPRSAQVDTGMLDLAAFGMDVPNATSEPISNAPAGPVESGTLDLAAFGLDLTPPPAAPPQRPPVQPAAAGAAAPAAAVAQKAGTGLLLPPPAQQQVAAAALHPVPSEVVAALQRLLCPQQEADVDAATEEHLARMGLAALQLRLPANSGSAVQRQHAKPEVNLPRLGLDETAAVLALAVHFSPGSGGSCSLPVDQAGLPFVTAVALACGGPLQPGELLQAGSSTGVTGTLQADARGSTAATVRRAGSSLRNAAGVEYTLPPSMALPSAVSPGGVVAGGGSVGRRWGLAPGLNASAVMWALLSAAPAAILEHALECVRARDAAAAAAVRASSTADDPSSAFVGIHGDGTAGGGVSWRALRAIGAGFWLRDDRLLRSTADALAKAQFATRRLAADAALLYAALGKKAVLQGLCRSTGDAKMADFLSRDFSVPQHRAAACKNAFVLLGQHRPELAAAFFILGGSPADAVSVCARDLGDVQLALLVTRLLHGPGSAEERSLIEHHLVQPLHEGWNMTTPGSEAAWAEAACAWMLGDVIGCLAALLPAQSLVAHAEGGHASAAQVLPALQLAAHSAAGTALPAGLSAAEILRRLLQRCIAASESLTAAGLSAPALQQELVAGHCRAFLNANSCETGSSGSFNGGAAGGNDGDRRRAAWACAAALLADNCAGSSPASDAAVDAEASALQRSGLDVETADVARRLKALQQHLRPPDQALPLLQLRPPAGQQGRSPHFSRQKSCDTQRSPLSRTSSARLSIDVGGRRGERAQAAAAGAVLGEGALAFQVEGDAVHAVCACPLVCPDGPGRPVVAATQRHGLVEGVAMAQAALPEPLLEHDDSASESSATDLGAFSASAGVFSRLLTQIFDASTWSSHNPLDSHDSAAEGDMGLALGTALANATDGTLGGVGRGTQAAALAPRPEGVKTRALRSHPTRPLFLSGCNDSGRVRLWQFGGPQSLAAFTPVPPADLAATQADDSLFSFPVRFAAGRTASATGRLGRLSNWGVCAGLAFSPNGERFAAVGDGGVVATWRVQDGAGARAADVDGAVCSEWWHHCLSKEGCAVEYVGGGSSVLAVGGRCARGNVALFDAASPPAEACVGRLGHHSATVNALRTLPGGWLLAAADAAGALSLADVRMLGGSAGGARVLWSIRAAKGAVRALEVLPLVPSDQPKALAMGAASGGCAALVTGSGDGMVRVWQASTGKLLQSVEAAGHGARGGGLRMSLGGGGDGSGVTGLAACADGLVCSSAGGAGAVKLFAGLMPGPDSL